MVVPVMAAVIAAVLIWAPPASFGTCRSKAPPAQFEIARALVEGENRVRSQASEGLVGKGQLGARFHAGPHSGIFTHGIADAARSRRGRLGEQLNVFDHLGDAGFLQPGGIGRPEREKTQGENQTDRPESERKPERE